MDLLLLLRACALCLLLVGVSLLATLLTANAICRLPDDVWAGIRDKQANSVLRKLNRRKGPPTLREVTDIVATEVQCVMDAHWPDVKGSIW